MERGDIYRASNSLRVASSTMWRNHAGAMDVFSRSSREEDDEEALRWAALEKLPTFDRLRKGILTASRGGADEIDIQNLGFHERKRLMERLVRVAEEDNEKFLLKLKNRIDRYRLCLLCLWNLCLWDSREKRESLPNLKRFLEWSLFGFREKSLPRKILIMSDHLMLVKFFSSRMVVIVHSWIMHVFFFPRKFSWYSEDAFIFSFRV